LLYDAGFNKTNLDINQRHRKISELIGNTQNLLVSAEKVSGKKLTETINGLSTRYGAEIINCEGDDRYLLSRKNQIPLIVRNKEWMTGGYRYSLAGQITGNELSETSPVFSKKEYGVNCIVEVEVVSLAVKDNIIKLEQPKIVDLGNSRKFVECIALLENEYSNTSPAYILYRFGNNSALLKMGEAADSKSFVIRNYSLANVSESVRFLADRFESIREFSGEILGRGMAKKISAIDKTLILNLSGYLDGQYMIRPILINKAERFLFYKIKSKAKKD